MEAYSGHSGVGDLGISVPDSRTLLENYRGLAGARRPVLPVDRKLGAIQASGLRRAPPAHPSLNLVPHDSVCAAVTLL